MAISNQPNRVVLAGCLSSHTFENPFGFSARCVPACPPPAGKPAGWPEKLASFYTLRFRHKTVGIH